jgi:hypothetical protein
LQKNPDFCEGGENPLFFVYYAQEFALFDRIFWKAGILTNSGVSVTIDSGRENSFHFAEGETSLVENKLHCAWGSPKRT